MNLSPKVERALIHHFGIPTNGTAKEIKHALKEKLKKAQLTRPTGRFFIKKMWDVPNKKVIEELRKHGIIVEEELELDINKAKRLIES